MFLSISISIIFFYKSIQEDIPFKLLILSSLFISPLKITLEEAYICQHSTHNAA